ncbi:hypothetical protein AB0G49_24710 [Streptomyces longwoodensis]|uniref:hypothetical protein n=1 Tax=Streptomyces longwoodensis TaxID=68231 RepID=UPI0033C12757
MAKPHYVTVCPPGGELGGRLVRIVGVPAGRAYGLWDLVVFLRRAGLDEGLADEDPVLRRRVQQTTPSPTRQHPGDRCADTDAADVLALLCDPVG